MFLAQTTGEIGPARHARGFTLIELLIVVAIIAILAAIAVPNFLEAQVRAKVSRAKSDMRSATIGIEAYTVDYNKPPSIAAPRSRIKGAPAAPNNDLLLGPSVFFPSKAGVSSIYVAITTPVAYVTSVFRDPFINSAVGHALSCGAIPSVNNTYDTYDYSDAYTINPDGPYKTTFPPSGTGRQAASRSSGANWHMVSAGPDLENCMGGGFQGQDPETNAGGCDYDSSNGTVSRGDIVRVGSARGPLYSSGSPAYVPAYDRAARGNQ